MNYKESITALLEGLKGIFENKTATEASAIAQAATKPSTIFYTSDTHAIVVGGQVYGRSNQVSADAPFAYLPADVSSPSADPQFDSNHDTIYIQPIKTGSDAGKIKLWWYVNSAWTSTDTIDLVLPTDASDITYDLTNTPDLGSGDVQSAIEALDGKVEEVKEDVVRTGYLIASWEDDKILTSTTYAVGSTIGEWGNGARYGCRGVTLNVKEGDKVLLDTYSPALFGLIFTDENRVVKALYDDRRFDGVWTAPCDGYCYIQDVLYRDCYHYASAHGHLAYMAHDARKRVAKGGDWYNEYAPRLQKELMPIEYNKKPVASDSASGNISSHRRTIRIDNTWALQCNIAGSFTLFAYKVRFGADNECDPVTLFYYHGSVNSINILTHTNISALNEEEYITCAIVYNPTNRIQGPIYWQFSTFDGTKNLHYFIDYFFVHTSSDFGELYQLAQKIISGEVEVDNFYGVREKEVDFVKNAIGLQSISDLGYNILDYGATLPIDEEGYKYAKEIYDRYKDNPPTSLYGAFANDSNLVYLPSIDILTNGTKTATNVEQICDRCPNLVCADKFIVPHPTDGKYRNYTQVMFRECYSLKRFGGVVGSEGIDSSLYRTFYHCYALEYVGKIDCHARTLNGVFELCYSLKRVEEISLSHNGVSIPAVCFNGCYNLVYIVIKEIGYSTTNESYPFNGLTSWGINSEENPDARQSLVDSLLTYSYDRVNDPDGLGTAGTTCTITLSANSYAQLTASEIEQITAKGYTLTHP